MTREEAIERMKTMRWEHATNPCPDRTAFDMAISALSENKGDLINRQVVINAIANTCFWLSADNWEELTKCINSIPSVENKEEWIPISERLPEIDQDVLATTRWGDVTIAERLNIGPDCWFICEGEANAHTEDIVAWQPLLEPYKAESESQ